MKKTFIVFLFTVILFSGLFWVGHTVQAQSTSKEKIDMADLYAYIQQLDARLQTVVDNQEEMKEQMTEEFKKVRYYTRRS